MTNQTTTETVSLNEAVNRPIDEVLRYILQAVNEWKVENTEEAINKKVKRLLNTNADQVTMQLLGFKEGWGKWEIDYANGRDNTSAVGNYMATAKSAAIKEFFDSLDMSNIFTATMKKQLTSEVKKEFKYRFENAVKTAARELAEQKAKALVQELLKSDDLDKTIQMLGLISK